jgi:hypothetical protein
MNSGEHSTISTTILCARAFFAPGKAFLSKQNEVVISYLDNEKSQISILISSRENVKPIQNASNVVRSEKSQTECHAFQIE